MSTQDEAAKREGDWFMDRLVNDGIKPHVHEIAAILASGEIPVVAFEPSGRSVPALEALGWKERAVFGVPHGTLSRSLAQDEVTQKWLSRQRPQGDVLLLVISHLGSTLLVNHGASGFSIEPGSLDSVLP